MTSAQFDAELSRRLAAASVLSGSLGRVERLASQVARLQKTLTPVLKNCKIVVFGADHGVSKEGVSAHPTEATRQMLIDCAEGRSPVNVLAEAGGIDFEVVNAGVHGGKFDHPKIRDLSMGPGTASSLKRSAMNVVSAEKAIATGYEIGQEGDFDAMGFGDLGVGSSSAATLMTVRLTGRPLNEIVGRGSGISGQELMHKYAVLRKANKRVKEDLTPTEALVEFGGYEMAMMAGAMIGAAEAGRVVLVDDYVSCAAAFVAVSRAPKCRPAMVFCHQSNEPGHSVLIDALGARPVLQLDMRMGEGTGAALAWPILKASVAMLTKNQP